MADFWNNINNTATTDDAAESVTDEHMAAVEAENKSEDTTTITPDPADEDTDGKTKSNKRGRKNTKKAFPTIDAATVEKIGVMLDTLQNENAVAVAKLLCDTSKSDPSALVAMLTETKNRKSVATFAAVASELADSSADDMKMRLMFLLMKDKNLSKTLFGVLNAVAPERGFGRASNDPMKDVQNVADHWGDGVDLRVIDKLKI